MNAHQPIRCQRALRIQDIIAQRNKTAFPFYREVSAQYQQLLYATIKTHMNKRSSCIRQEIARQVIKSINYTIDPVLALYHNPIQYLQQHPLSLVYEQGIRLLTKKLDDLQVIAQWFDTHPVLFPNERYQDVLCQQLPRFLRQYREQDMYIRAYYVLDDFDYPLLDGLALMHKNYHCQGVDFVLEYMERLKIEQTFIRAIPDIQREQFLRCYQQQRHISIEFTGCNFCEILLTQSLLRLLLPEHGQLLFERGNLQHVKTILQRSTIPDVCQALFTQLRTQYDDTTYRYLQKYYDTFVELLYLVQKEPEQIAIYEQAAVTSQFHMKESCEPAMYQTLLRQLTSTTDINQKLSYIRETPLGLYDYLDLFESSILHDDELSLFFSQLDIPMLGLFWYIAFPESGYLQTHIPLHMIVDEVSEQPWIQQLQRNLQQRSQQDQIAILQVAMSFFSSSMRV